MDWRNSVLQEKVLYYSTLIYRPNFTGSVVDWESMSYNKRRDKFGEQGIWDQYLHRNFILVSTPCYIYSNITRLHLSIVIHSCILTNPKSWSLCLYPFFITLLRDSIPFDGSVPCVFNKEELLHYGYDLYVHHYLSLY